MEADLSKFWRLMRNAILIDLAIVALVGGIGWANGWRTWFQYGTALQTAAAVVFLVAMYSLVGGVRFLKLKPMSQSPEPRPSSKQVANQNTFIVLMTIVGATILLLGEILRQI